MHIVSPIFLSYYLLPEQLGAGITRTSVTLLFLGTAACIEIARIALGIRLFGMRPYEGKRVSAYAQGALGLALAFFLFDHLLGTRAPYFVVPVFLGMAWIDPLAALARRRSSSSCACFGPSTIIADPVASTANKNCQLQARTPSIAYSVPRKSTK